MSDDPRFEAWMDELARAMRGDPEADLPEDLVVHFDDARWLGPEITKNPSHIGVLHRVPARSMEFYLQIIPAGTATDMQRHRHESVHVVLEGEGYSEIGPRRVRWRAGSLVYTPPWVWHRHYNDGPVDVRMLLVENSRLLAALGLARRESAGLVDRAELERRGLVHAPES